MSENQRVADSRQPLDIVEDSQDREIREEERILLRIVGIEHHHGQQIRRQFFDGHSLTDDFRRKLWLCKLLAVLGLNLRDIDVRADFERQLDGHVTVVCARRIEVEETVDAGQLQFNGTRDRFRDDICACTRVIRVDLHHRGSDLRKLSDG